MQKEISFTKEGSSWYVDLPDYLDIFGENSKGNLLMVAGADTFLDIVCCGKSTVNVVISDEPFDNALVLELEEVSVDKDMLEVYNHPIVDFGGNYVLKEMGHKMWLCPTLLYVFESETYPSFIYFKIL